MAYEARGLGDAAIVFVHGWSGDRSHWYAQMAGDYGGRRLVALDLLGHGESDKPEVKYSMELLARGVAAVLEKLQIDRAVLVGHSNGVPIVRQFYRMYPHRTEALVLVEGPLRQMVPPERAEWMLARLREPDYEQTMRMLVEQTPEGGLSPDDLARVKQGALATPKHVMIGGWESLFDPAVWQEDEIRVPTLVVLAESPQWTAAYEEFVRRLAPNVEYHVWDGVSHFLPTERPEKFNELLESFVHRL